MTFYVLEFLFLDSWFLGKIDRSVEKKEKKTGSAARYAHILYELSNKAKKRWSPIPAERKEKKGTKASRQESLGVIEQLTARECLVLGGIYNMISVASADVLLCW